MAGYISTTTLGNGTTTYQSDIVVKDLDLDVSNRVKDDTPVLNMAMTKKRKVNSTLPLWTDDIYRQPSVNAVTEAAPVNANNAEASQRYNLGNYTQIFQTTIASSGTARAVMQSGGDPQAYQEVKQLIELMFDVEQQLVRNDQVGCQYGGQTGNATGYNGSTTSGNTQQGRRMGSLSTFAGTQSFYAGSAGNAANVTTYTTNGSDVFTGNVGNLQIQANGTQYYVVSGATNQVFSPVLYKQMVTVAEQRYNAKIRTIVAPVSLRTIISDNIVSSNTSINRRNVERGDTIQTYEGDFNYTYEVFDSWIMDSAGVSNSLYFLNEEVLQWGALRDLGPNNEVFSNADASLDQFIMEGTLIVRNPAGVGMLNQITNQGSLVTTPRDSSLVQRVNYGYGSTY